MQSGRAPIAVCRFWLFPPVGSPSDLAFEIPIKTYLRNHFGVTREV